ncbi:extracellular solute-binding protein [Thiospirochaeta perfilievii]|uniref:Extracellular solute-binding protein n=1 Tax=Thiospirochaeta perfilievii TaxID=252967 RepID=A0A5C1Q8P5_9SPIO|nr:extracellular solute-binding protein [Thiospirochaeta perfilievii]QEN04463.1 extracellular solute-binding protein [Thiospirochaeta perfilievii]
MEKTKRVSTLLLMALFAFSSVFANGQKESLDNKPLIIYLWDDPVLVSIVEAYEKAHPEIVLDKQLIPASEYRSKLAILLAANADMDVWFGMVANDTLTQNENGFIEPLNEWFEKTGADMKAVDAYDQVAIQDGKIIGVPWRGGAYYTYYNKKLFKEKGVKDPTYYIERDEWTWDKFAEVSKEVASGDGNVFGGLVHTWTPQQYHTSVQAGKNIVTRDGKIDIGPETFTFLKLRKQMEAEKSMDSLIDMKVSRLHYSQAFFKGNLGMVIMGEWFPGMLKDGYDKGSFIDFGWDDWGIARVPNNYSDYRTWGVPTMVNVASRSNNKENAFKFVSWLGSEEGQDVVAKAGAMPAVATEVAKEEFSTNIPDEESLIYFFEDKTAMPGPITKYSFEESLGVVAEEYLLGELTDDQLIPRLTELLEQSIKESN